MKRFLPWVRWTIPLLILLLLLVAVMPGITAQAERGIANKPANVLQSALLEWDGGTYGAGTTMTLSNPGGTGKLANYDWWSRELILASQNLGTIMTIGFVKRGPLVNNAPCDGQGEGLFVYETNQYGQDSCQSIALNSSEINHDYKVAIKELNSGDLEY